MTLDDSSAAAQYPYRGIALMPGVMADLALEIFAGTMAKRSEIVAAVVNFHAARGGAPSATDATSQMKKALRDLARRGLVQRTGAYGLWRFADPEEVSADIGDVSDPAEDEESEALTPVVTVEQWVGSGGELVYVYSYPAYRELASARGHQSWPVKIGMSRSHSLDRIVQQVGTGSPEWPVVHAAIRCDDARELERLLHSLLRLRGQHLPGAPGSEWFCTSPAEILALLSSMSLIGIAAPVESSYDPAIGPRHLNRLPGPLDAD